MGAFAGIALGVGVIPVLLAIGRGDEASKKYGGILILLYLGIWFLMLILNLKQIGSI